MDESRQIAIRQQALNAAQHIASIYGSHGAKREDAADKLIADARKIEAYLTGAGEEQIKEP